MWPMGILGCFLPILRETWMPGHLPILIRYLVSFMRKTNISFMKNTASSDETLPECRCLSSIWRKAYFWTRWFSLSYLSHLVSDVGFLLDSESMLLLQLKIESVTSETYLHCDGCRIVRVSYSDLTCT